MPLTKKIPVSVLLREKSASVYWVSADASVESAVSQMNQHRIGSLLVKVSDKVVGIFTERDVLTQVVCSGRAPKMTTVREVMTSDFKSITGETYVEDAMQLMTNKRVRHLPVFDGEAAVGMISIGVLRDF